MDKTATHWVLASCASAVLLTSVVVPALGESGSPPDTKGLEQASAALGHGPAPAQATVSIAGFGSHATDDSATNRYAASPMGESASSREALAPREGVIVAVGNHAKSMCGPEFETGFAKAMSEVDVSFAGCKDRDAVELRLLNRVDMALLGGTLSDRERRAGLRQTKIGLELFALAVATDFPLQSLSSSQMRQLLTGQVRDWQQLGCDRGAVVVIIPSQEAVAGRAMRKLILGDSFSGSAIRVADDRHTADQILRNRGAIAVVRKSAAPPVGMKLLQIDWTQPTAEAFSYGTYPYAMPLHAVTTGEPDEFVRSFLDYAASPDGRELLGRTLLLP